ncbi:hypothetical protein [Streptomyces sp. NPDC090135]|uniref:hypothetical protein n=1 Tax=Streptomyces sp. NPDC090135 TaxID=3365957 RepID=UPI00382AEA28
MRDHEFEAPAHPTEDEDHAMRTRSAYEQLLSRLSGGERDFWDRPDGSWGENEREEVLGDAEAERREDANSAYVIGSKALRRDELDNARVWFAVAADAEHPGAAFRSALTAARSAARKDISACYNLLRTVPESREAEVWRWLRVAADWGHGDARHLISTLSGGGEIDGVTGRGAGGDAGGVEVPAPGRPVRVEDTEFYDELHAFLLVPGHGEWPESGQEPEAEPARSGEAGRPEDTGESRGVLVKPAGGAPGRSAAPLLPAHRNWRVLDKRRLSLVLVAACGEGLPGASGSRPRWAPDELVPPGKQVRERLALTAWPPAWQHVVRGWRAGGSGLWTELPPAVMTSPATSLQVAKVELQNGNAVDAVRFLLDCVMRLTTTGRAESARQRYADAVKAAFVRGTDLWAAGEQWGTAARAPLAWLVLNDDGPVVKAAGTDRLRSAVAGPSSLRDCGQDSAFDALCRFGYTGLWREWTQWLTWASSDVLPQLRHAAEAKAGRTPAYLWCTDLHAREPDWWVVLAHDHWPELDTVVNARRDADHDSAQPTDCQCARCARTRPDGHLPQARS